MEESYFRSIVKEEYEGDPWFTPIEVAHFLGLADQNPIHRYIYKGWLPAEKRPGKPWQGAWIIRKSAIDAFLKNDPRPGHTRLALVTTRHRVILKQGKPIRVFTVWKLKCPNCGYRVRIKADPCLAGPKVKELFTSKFNQNGVCTHGKSCIVERR